MRINTRTILAVVIGCITTITQAQECGTTVFENPSFGTTWTVDESPYCVVTDLQINGLTIEPGVVVLIDGPYEILVLSTITAIGTAEAPIIFTAKDQSVPWRGFYFEDTQPGSSLIYCEISYSDRRGLTIINSSPVLEHCTITNNSVVGEGGGIYANLATGDLVLLGCTISNNDSTSHGGGLRTIMSSSGQLVLDGCVVSGNTVNGEYNTGYLYGGGLYASGGDFVIDNCAFVSNQANSRCTNNGGCFVYGRGGGMYLDVLTGQCTNSQFINNRVDSRNDGSNCPAGRSRSYGGGINLLAGDIWISNCIFAGQTLVHSDCGPRDGGAGIWVEGGTATIDNTTIARNDDSTGLGGPNGALVLTNSIIYYNNDGGVQIDGVATITYSNIDNGYEGEGNIAFTPVFQGSGTSFCDLMIVPGSPCIDTGNPDPMYNDSQDCASPPFGTVRNDMGAHGGPLACSWDIELCPSPANLNGDCSVNTQDFIAFLGAWSSGEPIADWNDDGIINTQDFIAYLGDWVAGCP